MQLDFSNLINQLITLFFIGGVFYLVFLIVPSKKNKKNHAFIIFAVLLYLLYINSFQNWNVTTEKRILTFLNIFLSLAALSYAINLLKLKRKILKNNIKNDLFEKYDFKNTKNPILDLIIEEYIPNYKTIVIDGKQGSGKTKLGKLVAYELSANYEIIEIKAWDYDQEVKPLKLFLTKLFNSSQITDESKENINYALKLLNSNKIVHDTGVDHVTYCKDIIRKIKFEPESKGILFLIDELERAKGSFTSELIETITLYLGVEEFIDGEYKEEDDDFFASAKVRVLYIFEKEKIIQNLPKWWALSTGDNWDDASNQRILKKHFHEHYTLESTPLKHLINPKGINLPSKYQEIPIDNTRVAIIKISKLDKDFINKFQASFDICKIITLYHILNLEIPQEILNLKNWNVPTFFTDYSLKSAKLKHQIDKTISVTSYPKLKKLYLKKYSDFLESIFNNELVKDFNSDINKLFENYVDDFSFKVAQLLMTGKKEAINNYRLEFDILILLSNLDKQNIKLWKYFYELYENISTEVSEFAFDLVGNKLKISKWIKNYFDSEIKLNKLPGKKTTEIVISKITLFIEEFDNSKLNLPKYFLHKNECVLVWAFNDHHTLLRLGNYIKKALSEISKKTFKHSNRSSVNFKFDSIKGAILIKTENDLFENKYAQRADNIFIEVYSGLYNSRYVYEKIVNSNYLNKQKIFLIGDNNKTQEGISLEKFAGDNISTASYYEYITAYIAGFQAAVGAIKVSLYGKFEKTVVSFLIGSTPKNGDKKNADEFKRGVKAASAHPEYSEYLKIKFVLKENDLSKTFNKIAWLPYEWIQSKLHKFASSDSFMKSDRRIIYIAGATNEDCEKFIGSLSSIKFDEYGVWIVLNSRSGFKNKFYYDIDSNKIKKKLSCETNEIKFYGSIGEKSEGIKGYIKFALNETNLVSREKYILGKHIKFGSPFIFKKKISKDNLLDKNNWIRIDLNDSIEKFEKRMHEAFINATKEEIKKDW